MDIANTSVLFRMLVASSIPHRLYIWYCREPKSYSRSTKQNKDHPWKQSILTCLEQINFVILIGSAAYRTDDSHLAHFRNNYEFGKDIKILIL